MVGHVRVRTTRGAAAGRTAERMRSGATVARCTRRLLLVESISLKCRRRPPSWLGDGGVGADVAVSRDTTHRLGPAVAGFNDSRPHAPRSPARLHLLGARAPPAPRSPRGDARPPRCRWELVEVPASSTALLSGPNPEIRPPPTNARATNAPPLTHGGTAVHTATAVALRSLRGRREWVPRRCPAQ